MSQSGFIDNDSSLVLSNNADNGIEHIREKRAGKCSEDGHDNDYQIQVPVGEPWSIEDPTIKEFSFSKVNGMKVDIPDNDIHCFSLNF